MKIPFHEAWLSPKGEVLSDGDSHYEIAANFIKETDPVAYKNNFSEKESLDGYWYDYAYDFMWSRGYGRLVARQWVRDLSISTSPNYPQYRANLLTKVRKLAKNCEAFNELVCDKTGKTLWSRADTL